MYAVAKGNGKKGGIILIVLVLLIAAAVFVCTKLGGIRSDDAEPIAGETSEQREEYLLSLGIEVEKNSTISQVTVPKDFDERFAQYNEMLKTTGFDLEPFRGEQVKKCSFKVTNRPELGDDIGAVLLIRNNCIIAGHLIDLATSELFPLCGEMEDASQQTILPTVIPDDASGSLETSVLPEENEMYEEYEENSGSDVEFPEE